MRLISAHRYLVTLTVLSGLSVGACTLAPKLRDEAPPLSTQFANQQDWVNAAPMDESLRGEWWQAFDDAELNRLEARFTTDNLNYKAALAALEAARDSVRAARSLFLPAISANANATRSRTSANAPSYSTSRGPYDKDFAANAAVSYELDLFGRVRSAYQGLQAQTAAQAGDVRNVELLLRTQLAVTYFTLHAVDSEVQALAEWAASQRKANAQAKQLWQAGAMARADYDAAVMLLSNLESTQAEAQLRRQQLVHALALLVGADPSAFDVAITPLKLNHPLAVQAAYLPSVLLQRRPDISAALRRVQAANANIGFARAAYWPVFNLAGVIGRESQQNTTWWSAPSALWSGAAQGSLLLLDAGRRQATIDAAHANYAAAVAQYRQTVLGAVGEVEDILATRHALVIERSQSQAALEAAQSRYRIALTQLSVGTITQRELASVAQLRYQALQSAYETEARVIAVELNLLRSLGGGTPASGTP